MKKTALFLAVSAIVASVVISNSVFAVSEEFIDRLNEMGVERYEAEEGIVEETGGNTEEVGDLNSDSEQATDDSEENLNGDLQETKGVIGVANESIQVENDVKDSTIKSNAGSEEVKKKSHSRNSSAISSNTNDDLDADQTNLTPTPEEENVALPTTTPKQRLDFNRDGRTGSLDVGIIMSNWGPCSAPLSVNRFCMGDADLNGVVNFADVTLLLANWSPRMPADLNWDDVVGHTDLDMLIEDWGATCPIEEDPECKADVNSDGVVNFADITSVLAQWSEEGVVPVQ